MPNRKASSCKTKSPVKSISTPKLVWDTNMCSNKKRKFRIPTVQLTQVSQFRITVKRYSYCDNTGIITFQAGFAYMAPATASLSLRAYLLKETFKLSRPWIFPLLFFSSLDFVAISSFLIPSVKIILKLFSEFCLAAMANSEFEEQDNKSLTTRTSTTSFPSQIWGLAQRHWEDTPGHKP